MRTLGLVLALVFGLGVLYSLAALLGAAEARHDDARHTRRGRRGCEPTG